jgi:tetratricopeptide (TPR) repeat protein
MVKLCLRCQTLVRYVREAYFRKAYSGNTMSKIAITAKSLPLFLIFNLVLGATYCVGAVQATKLEAPPLPHDYERDQKQFSDGQEISPSLSRFKRRPDFREEEANKKVEADKASKAEASAKQKAAQEERKAQSLQVESYKKIQQEAIDANNTAVQFGKQGRWLDAILNHEKAVALDPRNTEFRINLSAARCTYARKLLAQGDAQGAAHLFRQALTAAPDNGTAGKLLVEALKKSGVNPSSAEARISVGDGLVHAGDFEGAGIEYQAAVQLAESPQAYEKMGDLSLHYRQTAAAAQWYRQALAKDADFGPAHRQLGFIAVAQRDLPTAAAELRKAVILDPQDAIAGQALVEIWRKQVASSPTVADNHLGLAGALQLTNQLSDAESEYRKVQSLDPKNPNLPDAIASLERAYQHAKAEKHKRAAEVFFDQGLRKEALGEISRAVMFEPRNAHYQLLLGESLEAMGDYQGAHQAYLTCVLIDPENNKEAALRLKQMQTASFTPVAANKGDSQFSSPQNSNQSRAASAAPIDTSRINSTVNSMAEMPSKDRFEDGSGLAPVARQMTTEMRTHDEANMSTPEAGVKPAGVDPQVLKKVEEAEASKDYSLAATSLRDILSNDLSNSELHHRLAVDLMSSGDIAEAISEFRIASALAPTNKDWSDDLARALSIHKRSLMSSAPGSDTGITGGAVK